MASMLPILLCKLAQAATLLCQLHSPGFATAGQMLVRPGTEAKI
jgi:hypothetical protein